MLIKSPSQVPTLVLGTGIFNWHLAGDPASGRLSMQNQNSQNQTINTVLNFSKFRAHGKRTVSSILFDKTSNVGRAGCWKAIWSSELSGDIKVAGYIISHTST